MIKTATKNKIPGERVPEIIRHADAGLTELGVASPVTCERQISIDANTLDESFLLHCSSLPIVGRIDFDFGNKMCSVQIRLVIMEQPFRIRLSN